MIVLDNKTSIGSKVTDGKKKGIIYGFGDALNENNFMVIIDWDNGEKNKYVKNTALRHLGE